MVLGRSSCLFRPCTTAIFMHSPCIGLEDLVKEFPPGQKGLYRIVRQIFSMPRCGLPRTLLILVTTLSQRKRRQLFMNRMWEWPARNPESILSTSLGTKCCPESRQPDTTPFS